VTRVRRLSVLVGLAILLAGCNVNARFDITMRADGTGTVRTTITVDSDAVQRLGGPTAFTRTVPLDDLRAAGWTVSSWKRGDGGTETIELSHPFVDQADLGHRIVDLAGPKGILAKPALTHERGWFSSRYAVSLVVDVRSPSVDIVHDAALSTRLRAAGVDPALLQAELAVQLRSALHVTVVVHLPGGATHTYDAATGTVQTYRASSGGTDWDHVVKFGIGAAMALLAGLFFLAAGVGARRNRRRAAQRVDRSPRPERTPLM
jgi:hypothetical protein